MSSLFENQAQSGFSIIPLCFEGDRWTKNYTILPVVGEVRNIHVLLLSHVSVYKKTIHCPIL